MLHAPIMTGEAASRRLASDCAPNDWQVEIKRVGIIGTREERSSPG